MAGVHLVLEEARRPLDERLEHEHEPRRRGGSQPADLAQQTEELGASRRQTEDRAHHGLDARPARSGAGQRILEGGGELGGGAIDQRFEQGLFGREPVEDRLLADAQALGQGIEGGRLVAAGAE